MYTDNVFSVLLDAPAPAIHPLPSDKVSLLRHLEKNSPEALALARDWEDTARKLLETQLKLRVYVLLSNKPCFYRQ